MEATKKRRVQNHIVRTKLENLSPHLIHRIMYFLPYYDATKFSLLSKSFYALFWLSFPVLDFDYDLFRYKGYPEDSFFFFIHKTLQLRGPHMKDSLQKLRLSFEEPFGFNEPDSYYDVFNMLLDFALQNKCKELDLDISIFWGLYTSRMDVSYNSLLPFFSSQYLTVLKVSSMRFPIVDSVITCPNLEVLLIRHSQGLRTLTVSSLSLKQVEIMICKKLRSVRLDAKNLESFKFIGTRIYNVLQPCDINLSGCKFIRCVYLDKVKVLETLMGVVTEFLYVTHCDMPKKFNILNPHIKELVMKNNHKVENLILFTPNLNSFKYIASRRQKCTMDISACLALKVLKLKGASLITEQWLRRTISGLGCLEELEICNCHNLEKVKIRDCNLQKLSLSSCFKMKEATVVACNLLQFYYRGSLQVYPMQVLSSKCCANIVLIRGKRDLQWFQNMKQFLFCFAHFKDIIISCNAAKDLITPREFMWANGVCPPHDVKHVKVEARDMPKGRTVTQLMESLLWLVPKPHTLTLSSHYTTTMSTLKFEYGKKVKRKEMEVKCCSWVPKKCWRHFELKIEFNGFDATEREDLNKFFAPYMH